MLERGRWWPVGGEEEGTRGQGDGDATLANRIQLASMLTGFTVKSEVIS